MHHLSRSIFIASLVALPFAPAAATASLVANGSFESPPVTAPLDDGTGLYFYDRPAANTLVPWSHGQMSILISRPGVWVAYDGNQYINVEPGFSGTVRQTIPTIPGQPYRLTFAYAPDPFTQAAWGLDNKNDLTASAAGVSITARTVSTTTNALEWSLFNLDFTALNTTTEISFAPEFSGRAFDGPLLDAVSVIAIPEPSAALLPLLSLPLLSRRRR